MAIPDGAYSEISHIQIGGSTLLFMRDGQEPAAVVCLITFGINANQQQQELTIKVLRELFPNVRFARVADGGY
jgi:hypothetical protein